MTKKKLIPFQEHLEEIKQNNLEDYELFQQEYQKKIEEIKHGGARAGAGRKPIKNKKLTISLTISQEVLKKIDAQRGKMPRSKYIELKLA